MASAKKTLIDDAPLAKSSALADETPTAKALPSDPPPPLEFPPPAPAPAAIPSRAEKKAAAPAAPAAPTTALYRVWAHGSLQRNGKAHAPGSTIVLPIEVGDAIVCLARVE